MKTYQTAIFDLDGTLLDSIYDLYLSTNYALRQNNWPERSLNEIKQFVGNGVGKLISRAVPLEVDDTEYIERCFEIFKQHYIEHCGKHTVPYNGILPMLQELQRRNVRTAIVSNKLQAGVDELSKMFFPNLIDIAIGEHPGAAHKPAPDMIDEAIKYLGVQKSNCLYIGDSEVDVQTALNAHVDCLTVLWGFREKSTLLKAGAKQFATEVNDILLYF